MGFLRKLGQSDARCEDCILRTEYCTSAHCFAGDVWWLDASDAFSQQLAYVNSAGNAIMKVDNTSVVPFNQKRNSVSFSRY